MEEWRDVIGYEGLYQVSSPGRVKRVAPGHNTHIGKILKPVSRGVGHLSVSLCKNGRVKIMRVHTLVLEAFVGSRPSYKHVCHHRNGDKKDNRVGNLEWVTVSKHCQVLHPTNVWA